MSDVFLSYSHKDITFKECLLRDLESVGVQVWNDNDITPGVRDWRGIIDDAIKDAGCIIVIWSPNSKGSTEVGNEIAVAENIEKPIIPFLVRDDGTLKGTTRLINYQRIDAREDYSKAFKKLIPALNKHLGKSFKIPSDMVLAPCISEENTPPTDEIQTPISPPPDTETKIGIDVEETSTPTIKPIQPSPFGRWVFTIVIAILLTILIVERLTTLSNQSNTNIIETPARSTLTIVPTTTLAPRCTSTPTPDPDHATLVAQANLTAIAQTPPVYATLRAQETSTAVARIPSAHATFVAQETATAASLAITPC